MNNYVSQDRLINTEKAGKREEFESRVGRFRGNRSGKRIVNI